jgi:hypothetical protein
MAFGLNSGSGSVFSPVSFTQNFGKRSPSIAAARFRTSLAYDDLVQIGYDSSGEGFIQPLENQGDGTLVESDPITISSSVAVLPWGVASGHLTPDSVPDIAVACQGNLAGGQSSENGVLIYRGDGSFGFEGPFLLTTESSDRPKYIKLGDLNLDCRTDILTLREGVTKLRVYFNLTGPLCN